MLCEITGLEYTSPRMHTELLLWLWVCFILIEGTCSMCFYLHWACSMPEAKVKIVQLINSGVVITSSILLG